MTASKPPSETPSAQPVVADISHLHKRARQQSLVDLFEEMRARAEAGEIVAGSVIFLESSGQWRHKRDIFVDDLPQLFGLMDILKFQIFRDVLDDKGE